MAVTLTDGGAFDLDGMANGIIVDPIVIGVDTLPPVITAPAAVTASSGDNLPVAVTLGTATATDAVDGTVAVTNNAPATFPVGMTTVTYTAIDAAGNTATATQLVTVNLVDTTPPTVTAPANVSIEATGATTVVTLGAATATDVVNGVIIPTNNAPAGFPVGITTVTYTATDAAGNTGTATQTVTVVDTTSPTITAPAAVTGTSSGAAVSRPTVRKGNDGWFEDNFYSNHCPYPDFPIIKASVSSFSHHSCTAIAGFFCLRHGSPADKVNGEAREGTLGHSGLLSDKPEHCRPMLAHGGNQ